MYDALNYTPNFPALRKKKTKTYIITRKIPNLFFFDCKMAKFIGLDKFT